MIFLRLARDATEFTDLGISVNFFEPGSRFSAVFLSSSGIWCQAQG
jgi:hypothetical protein